MRFTLVTDDRTVIIDGDPRVLDPDVELDENIHAVQWDGDYGEIEFKDPARPNKKIFDVNDSGLPPERFHFLLEAHAKAKKRDEEAYEVMKTDEKGKFLDDSNEAKARREKWKAARDARRAASRNVRALHKPV